MSYKRGLAVVIACVVATVVSLAATWPRFHHTTPTIASRGAGAPAQSASDALFVSDFGALPKYDPLSWARLTDAQRIALAPFANEWDQFSDARRRKWLRIASHYAKMSPEAQKRLQARMAEWVRMTPDERRVARENYQVSKDLSAQARQKAWKAYQQLSEEQKERLAASERRRQPTVVSAPPTGKREARDIDRLVNERERRIAQNAPQNAPAAALPAPNSGTTGASAPASVPAPASQAPVAPLLSPYDNPTSTYKGS